MDHLKSILLAEDNPLDVEMAIEGLSTHHLANQVVVVPDGEAALDYLYRRGQHASRPPEDPLLVLLDLKMPKVDGLEVLRAMKQDPKLSLIPVIVLTSSHGQQDLLRSRDLGINGYMLKPVDFHSLVDAIKSLGTFLRIDPGA